MLHSLRGDAGCAPQARKKRVLRSASSHSGTGVDEATRRSIMLSGYRRRRAAGCWVGNLEANRQWRPRPAFLPPLPCRPAPKGGERLREMGEKRGREGVGWGNERL